MWSTSRGKAARKIYRKKQKKKKQLLEDRKETEWDNTLQELSPSGLMDVQCAERWKIQLNYTQTEAMVLG